MPGADEQHVGKQKGELGNPENRDGGEHPQGDRAPVAGQLGAVPARTLVSTCPSR